jgi:hypothetical protein
METDLGPLAVLYCWQSAILAIGITTGTHGVKALIDFKLGGKAARRTSLFFNSLVLPATPIVLGAFGAMLIPIWPEALTEYLKAQSIQGWHAKLALACYGGAVGQFADYVWHRYSSVLDGVKARSAAKAEEAAVAADFPPASATPPAPPTPPTPPAIPPVI